MPRNTHATPGSYPSDDESSNHSGESGRLPRSRADEDHVAGMPRRAHSGTPSDSSTDTESENSEAPRGRAAERRDGQRLDSFPVGSLRLRPRRMPGLGRAQMRIDPPREFPWGVKFESLRPKTEEAIDRYLNRGHHRDGGHFELPSNLNVLLCVYFLCHDRGDGTSVHIRRPRPLARLTLKKLGHEFETAEFTDMVRALVTYCELQNCHFDKDLQDAIGRVFLEPGILAALDQRPDYQNLLRRGKDHPRQMALLLNRTALLCLI